MKIIEAQGFEDAIPEDRPRIFASFGRPLRDSDLVQHLEIHLEFVDEAEDKSVMGWFRASDLQEIINEAVKEAARG